MTGTRDPYLHRPFAVLGFLFLSFVVPAQDRSGAGPSVPAPSAAILAPPQPPPAKPPLDLFRSLLAMAPAERREFLATRPPEAQKLILAKIKEYEQLTPEARELRLRVTELRWYLLPLLSTPATNRAVQVSAIPNELRGLIEARLQEWDKLNPEVQRQLLDNESTVRFYFELAARTPGQRAGTSTNLSAAAQQNLEAGVHRWQQLTGEQRQIIVRNFSQFFDLTPAEKDKTLSTLSEPERAQIEKTLTAFESLTPSLRAECLRSFQKFASLGAEERRQFLKNAKRWEGMSPSERQSWRNLVSKIYHLPPLPPGLGFPPNPPPVAPAALDPARARGTWATNSN